VTFPIIENNGHEMVKFIHKIGKIQRQRNINKGFSVIPTSMLSRDMVLRITNRGHGHCRSVLAVGRPHVGIDYCIQRLSQENAATEKKTQMQFTTIRKGHWMKSLCRHDHRETLRARSSPGLSRVCRDASHDLGRRRMSAVTGRRSSLCVSCVFYRICPRPAIVTEHEARL